MVVNRVLNSTPVDLSADRKPITRSLTPVALCCVINPHVSKCHFVVTSPKHTCNNDAVYNGNVDNTPTVR